MTTNEGSGGGSGYRTPGKVLAIGVMLVVAAATSCSRQAATPEISEDASTAPVPSAACVPAIHGDLSSGEPSGQVLTLWHPYARAREDLVLALVDDFNRTSVHGITVLAESHRDPALLHTVVQAGVPDGRLPDMTISGADEIASYAEARLLAPMECYASDDRWGYSDTERGDFLQFSLDSGFIPQLGARYGWPFHASAEVLYFNEAWLAELGYEDPPQNWEEFGEMACAASQQPFSDSRGEGPVAGYEFPSSARQFATFILARGGSIANDADSAYSFGGQEGLDALVFLKDLTDRACARVARVRGEERDDFSDGRVLFTIAPIHQIPSYQLSIEEGAGFEWDITVPPHPAEQAQTVVQAYGPSFTVFRSTPERQLAAWTFIRWMSEPEQQARWATGTSYLPTRLDAGRLMSEFWAENPWHQTGLDLVDDTYATDPAIADYGLCRDAIEQMLSAVLAGGDAQTALDSASGRCADSLRPAQ